MHVPAILRAPGFLPAGLAEDRPMMSMDLLPTFLAMADGRMQPPGAIDGQSILPVMRGEQRTHEFMFWSFNQSRAVRQGDWKLILNPPQFPGEPVSTGIWLSNLEADLSERKNLAQSEPERVRKLIDRIRAWERYVEIPPAHVVE
jgi:arylsulfatase A-like enzyme